MPTKSYTERAAASVAATDAALDKLRAAKSVYRTLVGDDETDLNRSAAGLRQRFLFDDPDVTADDVIRAEQTLPLIEAKIDHLTGMFNRLRDRELTIDTRLCEALAPGIADALGGASVEVTFELPDNFNRQHAPRALVTPHGRVRLDAETGELSGQVRLAFLRSDLHRELDVRSLSLKLEDEFHVRLTHEVRSDGTRDRGDGLKLDQAHADVRGVLPERIVFPAGHQPTGYRALLEEVAAHAARSTATVEAAPGFSGGEGNGIMLAGPQQMLSAHEVNNPAIHRSTVEGDVRTVVVRGELALSPRVRGDADDATFAAGVLRREIEETVGLGFAGLGRVVRARVVGNPQPIRSGNRAGVKLTAEFALEALVEGGEAHQAA